jgi:hypothetical protein
VLIDVLCVCRQVLWTSPAPSDDDGRRRAVRRERPAGAERPGFSLFPPVPAPSAPSASSALSVPSTPSALSVP